MERGERMMVVAYQAAGDELRPGPPRLLFEAPTRMTGLPTQLFDVTPDGQRFVMPEAADLSKAKVVLVQNWFEELKQFGTQGRAVTGVLTFTVPGVLTFTVAAPRNPRAPRPREPRQLLRRLHPPHPRQRVDLRDGGRVRPLEPPQLLRDEVPQGEGLPRASRSTRAWRRRAGRSWASTPTPRSPTCRRRIDMVDFYLRSSAVGAVVDEAIAVGAGEGDQGDRGCSSACATTPRPSAPSGRGSRW